MKITNQKELEKLIATADESNTIVLNEDLEITFDCEIPCNINARNIKTHDITARNIIADNIKTYNIYAKNIITDFDINAHNITARNIIAHNIMVDFYIYAWNIQYHAFCIAYESLKCNLISGTRENSIHKCLDREIEIVKEEETVNIELTQEELYKIIHLI